MGKGFAVEFRPNVTYALENDVRFFQKSSNTGVIYSEGSILWMALTNLPRNGTSYWNFGMVTELTIFLHSSHNLIHESSSRKATTQRKIPLWTIKLLKWDIESTLSWGDEATGEAVLSRKSWPYAGISEEGTWSSTTKIGGLDGSSRHIAKGKG